MKTTNIKVELKKEKTPLTNSGYYNYMKNRFESK